MAYRININNATKEHDHAIGITLPYSDTNGRMFNVSYTTKEQALTNLKMLILTRKGERVMLPTFGTNIWDYIFENITDITLDAIRQELYQSIETWLPYLTIDDIVVTDNQNSDNQHIIMITINVSLNGQSITNNNLQFSMDSINGIQEIKNKA